MTHIRLALYLGPDQHKLGPGKVRLLEEIRERGSISAAARAMGMAYRHAWELVDDLNGCFATPVVAAATGGHTGGGASLTPWGEELVRRFRDMERATERALRRDLGRLDARLARRRAPRARRAARRL
jgi:molybdate transport system regulatory protein